MMHVKVTNIDRTIEHFCQYSPEKSSASPDILTMRTGTVVQNLAQILRNVRYHEREITY